VNSPPKLVLGLRPGDLVQVRSPAEIFSTLDSQGSLDGMPFMPEMLKYCGRSFQVSQRADKTCAGDGAVRRMHNAVHLRNVRCDGSAHGGCQAACLMYWKEAWLKPVEDGSRPIPLPLPAHDEEFVANTLVPGTRAPAVEASANGNGAVPAQGGEDRYRCQATEIPRASRPLRFREVDQYVRDVGNWNLAKVVRGMLVELFNLWQAFSKRHLPEFLLISAGRPFPFIEGHSATARAAPPPALDLQRGDLVRIKSKEEIEATLDQSNHNRGLSFDGEMATHCGRTARVRARVSRLVDEHTGEMIEIKSDCLILEGVVCEGDYHRFCPRAIYPYWREIWLERVAGPAPSDCGAPIETPAGAGA
jgi:hypothetical protein